ncbi:hypothetical protein OIE68_35085 [Nocardia vinacea]|uniref:Uncharacterized protein n=1 Tax=Nocardia vinacea TaxID=96468 RepID=A0ABZ1Z4S2_9NOCA|nr:hypothetical protein OIE68_35085 [Nocardia vinacea]
MEIAEQAQVEAAVIREVIDAVDKRIFAMAGKRKLTVSKARIYAAVIYEVLASARENSIGSMCLLDAPLLDSILDSDEDEGTNVFDRILEVVITS